MLSGGPSYMYSDLPAVGSQGESTIRGLIASGAEYSNAVDHGGLNSLSAR